MSNLQSVEGNALATSSTTGQGRNEGYLRAKSAWELLGISRSTFYALQQPGSKQYDASFPAGFSIGAKARVWDRSELISWVRSRKGA